MRVIGISETHTTKPSELVLVVDQDVPPDVVAGLEYGYLTFRADGRLLTVVFPEGKSDPFNAGSVAELNRKLAEAVRTRNAEKAKHRNMLEQLSKTAGLPLVTVNKAR